MFASMLFPVEPKTKRSYVTAAKPTGGRAVCFTVYGFSPREFVKLVAPLVAEKGGRVFARRRRRSA